MGTRKGIGSHQSAKMMKDEWITPPEIIQKFPVFDLDPCAPEIRFQETAKKYYTKREDGLKHTWNGSVWLNPPYGLQTAKWLQKMADHNNGICLIFARTETKMFFDHVWEKATAILFIKNRLYFYHSNGQKAKGNAGAPSVLIAYGDEMASVLLNSNIPGAFIRLKK